MQMSDLMPQLRVDYIEISLERFQNYWVYTNEEIPSILNYPILELEPIYSIITDQTTTDNENIYITFLKIVQQNENEAIDVELEYYDVYIPELFELDTNNYMLEYVDILGLENLPVTPEKKTLTIGTLGAKEGIMIPLLVYIKHFSPITTEYFPLRLLFKTKHSNKIEELEIRKPYEQKRHLFPAVHGAG